MMRVERNRNVKASALRWSCKIPPMCDQLSRTPQDQKRRMAMCMLEIGLPPITEHAVMSAILFRMCRASMPTKFHGIQSATNAK